MAASASTTKDRRLVPVRAAASRATAYRSGFMGQAEVRTETERAFPEVKKVKRNRVPAQSRGS